MSKPVLLLAQGLGIGGCERDLAKLAVSLDRQRYRAHVGSFVAGGMRADELRAAGIPIVSFPVASVLSGKAIRLAWQMRRYVREQGIELVHAFDLPTGVLASYTRLLGGPPLITSQFWERAMLPRASQFLLRLTDRIPTAMVANSEATRQELILREGLSGSRIFTIHNGVDLSNFHPGSGQSRPDCVSDAEIVIGTACALRPEKRLDVLLDAFARARRPGVKLLIVGSGEMLPLLERQRDALGLGESCWFEPQKSDVAPWLRAFDIFVLSSETESFPNALLEAMACGCAVAGSAVGGVPELIDDGRTGFLFPAGNAEALAGQLSKLMEDATLRRQLGQAAAERARNEFRMELNAEKTQALYDRVLN
jgi:glycosyltransferase involved in cell wall biosynthesis